MAIYNRSDLPGILTKMHWKYNQACWFLGVKHPPNWNLPIRSWRNVTSPVVEGRHLKKLFWTVLGSSYCRPVVLAPKSWRNNSKLSKLQGCGSRMVTDYARAFRMIGRLTTKIYVNWRLLICQSMFEIWQDAKVAFCFALVISELIVWPAVAKRREVLSNPAVGRTNDHLYPYLIGNPCQTTQFFQKLAWNHHHIDSPKK